MNDAMRAWWPRRLQHQMLVLLASMMVVALALLYQFLSHRMAESARRTAEGRAFAVAQSAVRAGAAGFAARDADHLERALAELAAVPGVIRIDAMSPEGELLTSLQIAPHGAMLRGRDPTDLRPPRPGEPPAQRVRLGEVDAVRAWTSAGPAARHGSLAVTYDLAAERGMVDALRLEALLACAGVGVLAIALVYGFMTRALAPLKRLVHFANDLALNTGRQIRWQQGSREMDELAAALNCASATLRQQLDAIRCTEDRTAAILNAAPDATLGLDAAGCVTLVNPAVTSILGCDPAQIVGQPIGQWLPEIGIGEAERRTLQGLYVRSSNSHVARLETTARRHDGTEFPAELSLARVETADGVRYACVVRDVTEARTTYAMLNLYNRALECTTNGVVISDMSLPGSPVFYANPAFARITGYDVSEAIGRNCKFLQGDDADQPEIDVLRDAVNHGEPATVVLRNYRKDGTLFFNELAIAPVAGADGAVRHYVGVIADVSERERSRMALAERSARLNAVFDLSPDGYLVFDRQGVLLYCNRAFMNMTGWSGEALAGGVTLAQFDQHMRAMCDPNKAYPPVAHLNDGAAESFDTEHLLELVRPRRAVLTRLARCNVGAQGESILYFRDVTRETEVDRMKSEFLTTAAHELRTPMVSVFGFTELLLNRPVPEAKRRDVLETIHRQASLLINMVNELLDLARIEARQGKDLKREACRLGALVDEAVAGLMVHGDPRRVLVDMPHADVCLFADPHKMNRALTNVLSNAYKYSPHGGCITLATLEGDLEGLGAVGVRVTDQGIGMTPEQLQRVCERFYRADPSGNIPGTGLGMSLVKEIVDLHGGRIELASEPGRGTTVTLWLPRAGDEPSGPRAAMEALPAP